MRKTRGLIAAGHDATAEAAAVILEEGGNAFDAAIAALLASFVAEPGMSSAGGGAFMTAFQANGKAIAYDCFVQTPRNKRPAEEIEFLPIEIDFGTAKEVFYVGMGSVAVPGTIAGLWKIHRDMGSLPMKVLAAPAIQFAKEGVEIDPFQYHDFCLLEPILSLCKPSPVFWKNGEIIKVGEKMFMPELADTLDHLVREGEAEFYHGEIAKLILQINDKKGGHLKAEDLANYEAFSYDPLRFNYRGRTILTNPLPSLGGSLIAIALAKLTALGSVDFPSGSVEQVQRLGKVFSDLDQMVKTPANLAQELMHHYPDLNVSAGTNSIKKGGTTHFSILDEFGNAVSVTSSNGEGCGHFVPGTGIILNNMMGETALLPNGLHSWEPGTRLGSMMSPTIVLDKNGNAEMVLGSGGAGRIPNMLTQVIHQVVDHGADIENAVNAPRIHTIDKLCNIEPGLPLDAPLPAGVKALVWEEKSMYFGGVHAVLKKGNDMHAMGDRRRGGVFREAGC